MREIKFRAFNKRNNKMASADMLTDMSLFALRKQYDSTNFIVLPQGHDIELMQYTGLKDKNGVEIYEGDIVKYEFNNLNFRIRFQNGSFILSRKFENIENMHLEDIDYGREVEVIGNIYENKELLGCETC